MPVAQSWIKGPPDAAVKAAEQAQKVQQNLKGELTAICSHSPRHGTLSLGCIIQIGIELFMPAFEAGTFVSEALSRHRSVHSGLDTSCVCVGMGGASGSTLCTVLGFRAVHDTVTMCLATMKRRCHTYQNSGIQCS